MSLQPFDETEPIVVNAGLFHGSGTVATDLFPTEPVRRRVDNIVVNNGDTIDHVIRLLINFSGFNPPFTRINVPAGTSFTVPGPVDLMAALPTPLQAGFALPANVGLQVVLEVDATAAGAVVAFGFGGYV